MFGKRMLVIGVLMVAVAVLVVGLPLGAQDEWPEGCELPDFEEVLRSASIAQTAGAEARFLDALSEITDIARTAYYSCMRAADIQRIIERNWRTGDFLQNVNLQGANLRGIVAQRALFRGTNLQAADLENADLLEAVFWGTNLQGADLSYANLQRTGFHNTNLQGADLHDANLQGAGWTSSAPFNLGGANLQGANLQEMSLAFAIFDANTTLPDGTNWTLDTDMTIFTDPEHPHFWRGFGLAREDLSGMDFSNTNLQGANMIRANFEGANFDGANLQGAKFGGATFDATTTLPDGTNWTEDTDMGWFTDLQHPDYWCSDDRYSPAYCGDDSDE